MTLSAKFHFHLSQRAERKFQLSSWASSTRYRSEPAEPLRGAAHHSNAGLTGPRRSSAIAHRAERARCGGLAPPKQPVTVQHNLLRRRLPHPPLVASDHPTDAALPEKRGECH
eukprot:CAMPEP_0177795648 /NCGR_PEP_ID=MMETSP0491_2-20121128/26354_1 /TAXON_ID=63592 /ORGANISM="Tetraselmis chuii, Strain PLY429" /LENGTH=112 /DNA_ID=CAMNT_0019318511 /DNA_START=171 /DNA_END=509 /DNA_ORIENTATION=+